MHMPTLDLPTFIINEIAQQVRAKSGIIHVHTIYGGVLHGFSKLRTTVLADYSVMGTAIMLTNIAIYNDTLINIAHSEPQYMVTNKKYEGVYHLYNNQLVKYAFM